MFNKEIGFIGIGNMGTALLCGILSSNIIDKEKIVIYDIDKELLHSRTKEYQVSSVKSNLELVQQAKYILIAVKPHVINLVLKEIGQELTENHVLFSIVAGISLDYIKKFIPKEIGLIRAMPNTPALVGEAASAIAYNDNIKKEDLDKVKQILNSIGIVVVLEEKLIDAVTGLSGSGPAYIFIIIEALSDAGVKMGLPRDISLKLAAQTILGSAKMLLKTGKHPGQLKDMVTSPGGTTIAGIHELEKGNLRATLINAVEAATLKSKSMK